ncbi:hypothetical protein STEG23_007510 [Scotinomys teguina]
MGRGGKVRGLRTQFLLSHSSCPALNKIISEHSEVNNNNNNNNDNNDNNNDDDNNNNNNNNNTEFQSKRGTNCGSSFKMTRLIYVINLSR